MKFILMLLICIIQVSIANCDYRQDVLTLYNSLITGYNINIRPDSTVNVSVGLTVLSINLDSNEETFTVSGKFTVTWNDQPWELNINPVESFQLKEGLIWRPELVIENMVDDMAVIADENLMYRLYVSGAVTWEPAVNMKVHCPHDFTYYPFDKQTCGITVSSWSYDHNETPLQALSDQIKLHMYKKSSDFEVVDSRVETSEVTETQGSLYRTYSKLTFYITVRRHPQFYGLTLILPLVLMSALTTISFLLPPESGEKANYNVTVLLMIIVVFYTMVFGYVPVFSGVSVLVVYGVAVLIVACLAIVCDLLVLYLYHQGKHTEMKPLTKSVLHILARITCRQSGDTLSVVLSEETTRSRMSEHDLHACSSLPNGNISSKKPGRLSPINRRVVPSETFVGSDVVSGERLTHHEAVPPVNTGTHSDTPNGAELMKVAQVQNNEKNHVKESTNIRSPWQEMSVCLDRLFFVIFVVASFIIHFIFLILLGTGSA